MADIMQSFVSEAKKNRFSALGHSVLSDEDVVSVWENVSAFIDKQMSQQKGVMIPGLGTFTFSQKKLDVGNNKYILIQRPLFLISEKFAATHGLNHTKHHTTGQIPVVHLNYSALSFESPFDRDTVETCVREVVGAVSRTVASRRNVEFMFSGIGRLQIKESKVKMRFYKSFLNSMDGSGKLIDMLRDRPGTVDSVMSDRPMSRPMTNTLILPRILGGNGANSADGTGMPTIREEEAPGTARQGHPSPGPEGYPSPVNATNNNAEEILRLSKDDEELIQFAKELEREGLLDDAKLEEICQTTTEMPNNDFELFDPEAKNDPFTKPSPPPNVPPSRQGSRMSFQLPKAAAVSFADDLLPATPKLHSACSNTRRSLSPIHHPLSATPRLEGTPKPPSVSDFTRSKTMDRIYDKIPGPMMNGFMPTPPPPPPAPGAAAGPRDTAREALDSSCGHHNAGQELCYLCHQRDRRNIPVSFTEERKKREMEEDRLLAQYQQMKDVEAIFKEQETVLGQRHENQKTAAFNLGVAEAIKEKKIARETGFHTSYVFQKRPLTAPRFKKQEAYYKDLADQVVSKAERRQKRKADEEFLERLEQVQLAEDLAAQREQYLKEKMDQQDQYKRALSAQVRFKPLPIPSRVSDSSEPVFGKNDMTNEGLAERRRRAYELYKEQVGTVEQRKREAILKRLNEHKDEETVLQRNKKELREDRADRYERLMKSRKRLEDDWLQAAEAKRTREVEERQRSRSPGNLLLEQTNPYKRCGQCKRNMHNTGESNIWRESRYIPGSRLIV